MSKRTVSGPTPLGGSGSTTKDALGGLLPTGGDGEGDGIGLGLGDGAGLVLPGVVARVVEPPPLLPPEVVATTPATAAPAPAAPRAMIPADPAPAPAMPAAAKPSGTAGAPAVAPTATVALPRNGATGTSLRHPPAATTSGAYSSVRLS